MENEDNYDEIIATLTQLLEQYEQLPEDASGAGYSKEKQEGNVHGYEQEDVTNPGDSFTTKQTEIEEKEDKKSNIEVEEIENPDYIYGEDLVGDTKKVNVQLFCRYNSKMEGQKNITNALTVKANYKNRILLVTFDEVDINIVIKNVEDRQTVCIEINENVIAKDEKYQIILRKGTCYKLNRLSDL